MTVTFDADPRDQARPFYTTCDLCDARMAAVPGPMNRRGRPMPPIGFALGYIVESAEGRQSPRCISCLTPPPKENS